MTVVETAAIEIFASSFLTTLTHTCTHILTCTCRKECEELEADERNMDSKIKKKQEELDRTEKRLRSLESVRPQFMDEVCEGDCRQTDHHYM